MSVDFDRDEWLDFWTDLAIDRNLEEDAFGREPVEVIDVTVPRLRGDGYWCQAHGSACFRLCEDRRWGRYGAAGVLFVHPESESFLLSLRSGSVHHGGTWAIPGGALDHGESAEEGARREVAEELGLPEDFGRTVAAYEDRVGDGWSYTTVVVEVDEMVDVAVSDWESEAVGWFTIREMATLRLHPGFRQSFWRAVREWRYGPRSVGEREWWS